MSDNSLPFDRQQALRNVGGGEELLHSIAQLFAEECRKQLADIRQAHRAGDAQGVSRSAHALKGSLALLAADPAAAAARSLEQMGRAGDLSTFEQAWSRLLDELNRLMRALQLPPAAETTQPVDERR